MNKIETHQNPNWLALHESDDLRELILDLCAQGLPDVVIASELRASDLVERCAPEDIAQYRLRNVTEITAYIDKNMKQLLKKAPRASKVFRIGEMDRMLGAAFQKYFELIETDPKVAAQIFNSYQKGVQMIAVAAGDWQAGADTKNWMIETFQRLTPDRQQEFMQHIMAAEKIAQDAGVQRLPDPHVVDAEYEVIG